MSKFIKVHTLINNVPHPLLINVDRIVSIEPRFGGSGTHISIGTGGDAYLTVRESFENLSATLGGLVPTAEVFGIEEPA